MPRRAPSARHSHRTHNPSQSPPRSAPIKRHRSRPLARPRASGYWASPPSLGYFGSSVNRTRIVLRPRHPPTRRPRKHKTSSHAAAACLASSTLRRQGRWSRRFHCIRKNQNHRLGRISCSRRPRSGIAWPKTSAWKAQRPLSTTTATPMWIGSMQWWPTTTAAAGASAIEVALWKARAETLSRTGANFRQRERADLFAAHLQVHFRHKHRHVLLQMRR